MSLDIAPKNKNQNSEKFSFAKLIAFLNDYGSVSNKEILFFVKNLQVMSKSGIALDKSLKTLAEQTDNKKFKKILLDLALNTEKGQTFADSLNKYNNIFSPLFINMVEAGEISGRLEQVLGQIYIQLKKLHDLKSKIISALIYPIIVVCAMILIGIGMMIFVVPKITDMFSQFDAELPIITRCLIAVSDFIVNNGIFSFLFFAGFIAFITFTIKSRRTKKYWHWFFLKTPIFGPIIKKVNLSKFCRTLSSLMEADIAIVKSFETVAQVLNNYYFKASITNSADELRSGVTITKVLQKYPNLFPPVVTQMVSSGEETGTVDEILKELASFYEDDIDQTMKTLPTIIEPVLILILGVGVALMAIAIVMPMYTITQHID